jgi:hypothetical protein
MAAMLGTPLMAFVGGSECTLEAVILAYLSDCAKDTEIQ